MGTFQPEVVTTRDRLGLYVKANLYDLGVIVMMIIVLNLDMFYKDFLEK